MSNFLKNIYKDDKNNLLKLIKESLLNGDKKNIITTNSEIISNIKNKNIKNILTNKDNIIICDGIGFKKVLEFKTKQRYHKITGIELLQDVLSISNKLNSKIYFYGSSQKTISRLKEIMFKKYSNLKIVGLKNGYDYNEKEIQKDIIKNEPDVLVVALGAPRQELFINSIYDKLNKGIMIGVGGSLDVISGSKKRAPKIFRKMNLEWLYRLVREPRRIIRFVKSNVKMLSIMRRIK